MHCQGIECPMSFYFGITPAKGPKSWSVLNEHKRIFYKYYENLVNHPGSLCVHYYLHELKIGLA
jgi:hypothetical protein